MNFGYPNTPYAPMDNMNMTNMSSMTNMSYGGYPTMPTSGCGCCDNFMMASQLMQPGCNQVVQKSFVEEMPYYVNYNTHVINNVVRRHIQIPVYSQTQETVYFDEWQNSCGCNR